MIKYRSGYKYQLAEMYEVQTVVRPSAFIGTPYIELGPDGLLTIEEGYAWDGPSGLTIDTKDSMRAALVHDAFYQLLREGELEPVWRKAADKELLRLGLEDGMWSWRIKLWYRAVRLGAGPAADPANVKEVKTAP